MSLRLGFFGAGLIATAHANSLRASGAGAEVATVFDPDTERARRFADRFGARATDHADQVLDGVDAVYVCTWTSAHPELVAAAAEAGLAVFCEKPLGVDLATAAAMTATVQRARVTNQVGLVLRSVPGFALMRRLLGAEGSGRVMTAVFRDDQELPLGGFYGSTWRADRDKAGAGTLLEHSVHDLDLLEWLCGPVASVSAYRGNFHGLEGIEDTVAVSFMLADGGTGVLTSTWHDIEGRPSCRRFEVFTESGWFEAEGNAAEAVRWEHRAGERSERAGAQSQADELRARGAAVPHNADAAFVAAVRERRAAFPDFAVALRAHILADAVYRSAESGGATVAVPPPGPVGPDGGPRP